ncbi:hypothetical protein LSH36_242g07020 [Paralvinella palmiformis]|uniref:Uncharacterized protein n=1 Tax=Paralvinella palmiformis TaxID=53620 RepID=A0AAD9JMD2_9ANNE|nr:hypothetical protein LSH36_242g07020 [Paralvinella palmiformis]
MDSLRKECKKNVHEVGVESAVQKSKFFTELDVIRTPDRREASGSSDYERTLSSRVTELRLKAKNVSLPKTQPVTSIQPSNVLMSASLDTGRSQARSSTYNDIIDTDLLDFTKPVTEPLPTEPITDHTTSASSHQARHPSVFGSEVPLFPQQNIASVHGQPLSLIPCASHIPDKSSSRSVDNTKQLLDFNTPITDNVSTQPPQHVASMFLTSDQSQQKCQNSVDLSFFENPLSQTNNTSVSCTSKRFTNWEKF